jgi:hypothetical protein
MDETTPSQRAMADVDKVAEAICGATSAGQLFPWPTLTESEREAWRRMAVAAIDVLRVTEETKPTDAKLGQVRVNPDTGTVAVYRNGNKLTGPMWFLVPQDDDPRWERAADQAHAWPFLAQALG